MIPGSRSRHSMLRAVSTVQGNVYNVCLGRLPVRGAPVGCIEVRREVRPQTAHPRIAEIVEVDGPPVAAVRVSDPDDGGAPLPGPIDANEGVRGRECIRLVAVDLGEM